MYPKVFIHKNKVDHIHRKHPWIFSGAIQRIEGNPSEGDVLEVCSNQGDFLALGTYQAEGSITVRVLSFENESIDDLFWKKKLEKAWSLRKLLGLTHSRETNIYRLVHAEGDGLPGLIIDVYHDTAVIQCHTMGMYKHREAIVQGLIDVCEQKISTIYDKSAESLPKKFKDIDANGCLWGEEKQKVVAREYNSLFEIDWVSGQKTGFFIDQRENRQLLASLAKDKKILNTFCYSGGFSIAALNAGATEVHSLDSSQKALDLVERNVEINNISNSRHKIIKADAVEYMKSIESDYDVIVLDPPAFAKHMGARHNAIQAYRRLNAQAIRQIKSGGLIFTFSCSQVVDKNLFKSAVVAASIEVGRECRILQELEQPHDHPVSIFHPEGSYLKGLLIQVL